MLQGVSNQGGIILILLLIVAPLSNAKSIIDHNSSIKQKTNTPSFRSHYDEKSRALAENTQGTALAPTTPGGLCLNESTNGDYFNWTTGKGFDFFGPDLEKVSASCAGELGPCPFLKSCVDDRFAQCVTEKMSTKNAAERVSLKLEGPSYSLNCADCMGKVARCSQTNCQSKCIFGETNPDCETCTATNCNNQFRICSGLNADRKEEAEINIGLIVGCVGGGFVIISLVLGFVIMRRLKDSQKAKDLTLEDMAMLSRMQQVNANYTPGLGYTMAQPSISSNSSYGSLVPFPSNASVVHSQEMPKGFVMVSPPTQPQQPLTSKAIEEMMKQQKEFEETIQQQLAQMTPYQREFFLQQQQQQQQQQQGPAISPAFTTPPKSVVQMIEDPTRLSLLPDSQSVSLRVMYNFNGERSDELTVKKGEIIKGFEENENWWLAKTSTGIIGLIPSNYVEAVESGNADPEF